MNCDASKTEIENDFLAKTNGKYSVDLQRHLMSCRKCRDHGIALTRVLQSAQLDKIEDIPGPLIKKSLETLSKIPVAKEKRGLRLVHFTLGTLTALFTIFIAYRGIRNKTAYEAQASSPVSNSLSKGLPEELLPQKPDLAKDASLNNAKEKSLGNHSPKKEDRLDPETLECNFKTESDGFFADFFARKKDNAASKGLNETSLFNDSSLGDSIVHTDQNNFNVTSETAPDAKNKNEPLLSVESLYSYFGGTPLKGTISGLGIGSAPSLSGNSGPLSGPANGNYGNKATGPSGNSMGMGGLSGAGASLNSGTYGGDGKSQSPQASFETEDQSLKINPSESDDENSAANTCEMPPSEKNAKLALGETEE